MSCPNLIEDVAVPAADRLLAAALYLMSCHARTQCPRLACMIERHLDLIARHPGAGERVADTCRRLALSWVAIRQHDEHLLGMARFKH
jgi:hypothetical protein